MANETGALPTDLNLSQMFKDVKLTMWVAKDTYYTIKYDTTINMNVEGSVMQISMTAAQSKFNQPVTINLPAAAAKATEISSFYQ
jgi:phytoene dehydrogenase-like protein